MHWFFGACANMSGLNALAPARLRITVGGVSVELKSTDKRNRKMSAFGQWKLMAFVS
jgi:hypothetical protein